MATDSDGRQQSLFQKLKPICVPLLEKSQLTPVNVPTVLRLLSDLENILHHESDLPLSASLASYVFYPISTILRRNVLTQVPDRVLEQVFNVLAILCDSWWWDCELEVWTQLFMLCSSILGGLEGKGKNKTRSDETRQAAAMCLLALTRERDNSKTPSGAAEGLFSTRIASLQSHAQSTKFIPVLGQTIDSLLTTSKSRHRPLQHVSLRLLDVIIRVYAPNGLVASVLPGVISTMSRVALGTQESTGQASGDIVAGALLVMQNAVVISIGDAVCIADGAVRSVVDLEDLVHLNRPPSPTKNTATAPYLITRTPSWLQASASQLHIALNALTPLVYHPTAVALVALANMAKEVLSTTSLTLPQSQPLLLSWLLSLSNSSYPRVAEAAYTSLLHVLTEGPTNVRQALLQTLMHISKECMNSLPISIASQADARIEHIAGHVEAICRLAMSTSDLPKDIGLSSISGTLHYILGPGGGIEKWGWTLLSVLQFKPPPVSINPVSMSQLLLEGNPEAVQGVTFPEVTLKNVLSGSAADSLARMFRALGRASGDHCLYAVEWFVKLGLHSKSDVAVSALWCAVRLLEGVSDIPLTGDGFQNQGVTSHSKHLEKFIRSLTREVAELWTAEPADPSTAPLKVREDNEPLPRTEVVKGVKGIRLTLDIAEPRPPTTPIANDQMLLHRTFCLQLLALGAGILQARFTGLLIHVIYPVLHSIVSPNHHCSLSGMAALAFIANATSYASPGSLLLSHFDYALDGVSRRLNHRWFDVDATKVFAALVRLVGSDIVEKAGDVVEECFDRLDEYHGYEVIVEGLMEVLGEVVKAIETDEPHVPDDVAEDNSQLVRDLQPLHEWIIHRNDTPLDYDDTDYGPAPHEAWGDLKHGEGGQDEPRTADREEDTAEQVLTSAQSLTKQMVSRSIHFLTYGSPVIRARILSLLTSATPVMPESALLPSIHQAWPFILNRLNDQELFVVSAAAELVEALASHVGNFMGRRIWDDIWPRFHAILKKLEAADGQSALARRGYGAVGTESAYTTSHRLYRSIIKTMTAAVDGVYMQDAAGWDVILAFRRFLHCGAHAELQMQARELYTALSKGNEDAVWLALMATSGRLTGDITFLREAQWDINENILLLLDK
ncbi:armadillo-type protein [Pisolithus croceorrhizus]|nr:armadillo-type protein [Pisolithus croceorrhizus]